MEYDCREQEVIKAKDQLTVFTAYKLALYKAILIMGNKIKATSKTQCLLDDF